MTTIRYCSLCGQPKGVIKAKDGTIIYLCPGCDWNQPLPIRKPKK